MTLSDAEVAIKAAQAGAEVVAQGYGREQTRLAKSSTDFATQTDLDAEAAIMEVLQRHRPNDARLGEESGRSGNETAARRWLIDPLCGTLNFAAQTPLIAVNVALVSGEKAIAAATADPVAGELYWAEGAEAYFRAGTRHEVVRPNPRSRLVEIDCDGPLDKPCLGGQLLSDPMLRKSYGPRVISSSLGVVWVANGRRAAYVSDGHFRNNVHFAAGIAICRAAGCIVTDLRGNPLHTSRGLVISADRQTHDQLLAVVEPNLAEASP